MYGSLVSLVLVNNEAGAKMFDEIKNDIIWKATRLEDSMQPAFVAPYKKPNKRDDFWNDYKRLEFGKVLAKYTSVGCVNKIKCFAKRTIEFAKRKICR